MFLYLIFFLDAITDLLNIKDLINFCQTDKTIYQFCLKDSIWQRLFYKNFILLKYSENQIVKKYGSFRNFIYSNDFFTIYDDLLYPDQDIDLFRMSHVEIKKSKKDPKIVNYL